MSLGPLDGFTIGITADRRWEQQAELLTRRGATVLHGPTISTLYLGSDEDLRRATLALIERPPDYLVATTGIGMRAWLEAASASGLSDSLLGALAATKVIARGPKAAGAVEAVGLPVWQRSPTEQMEALQSRLLDEPLAGCVVAIQEHGLASPRLGATLGAAGATVVAVPVYRWRLPDDPRPALRLIEEACVGRLNAITFTSAPAVHNLFAIAGNNGLADQLLAACNGGMTAACVGPVCAEGARQEGIDMPLAPDVGRLGLLVRTISEHFESRRRVYVVDDVELVVQGSVIEVGGVRAELTPLERSLFDTLAARPGAVVSRSTLLVRAWGAAGADPHVLEVTIGRLRRKLGPAGGAIVTSPGRGYRFAGAGVERLAAQATGGTP
ncbi:MAG: uroporphyrinogen-III synthase [Actinomycetota bacterium]|nr:uroporphyrinogen-III synthase [Actinomycetota bacterium]